MKEIIKKTVNSALGAFGLAVTRKETIQRSNRCLHLEKNAEELLDHVYRMFGPSDMPKLPPNKERHKAMVRGLRMNLSYFYILESLHKTLSLEGDVCEFGVAYGGTSLLLALEVKYTPKRLWLFDSFKGLSKPTEKDVLLDDPAGFGSMDKYEGSMAHPLEEVMSSLKFAQLPPEKLVVVPGYIEESSKTATLPEKICFAYVDMDLYEPIRVVLSLLHERLVPGGIVITDDYGNFSEGAKTAVDEFVASHRDQYTVERSRFYGGGITLVRKP